MITIPCALIPVIRPVFRRALHLSNRDNGPNLLLTAGPDGLRIRVRNDFAAAEYHLPGEFPVADVQLPFAVLADCRGGKRDSLTLRQESPQVVTAEWTDKQIPQLVQYGVEPSEPQEFPPWPEAMSANEPCLWSALDAAVEVTEPDSTRYTLGCLQLRAPVQASDEQRTYVWAPLDPDKAVRSSPQAVRIDSAEAALGNGAAS